MSTLRFAAFDSVVAPLKTNRGDAQQELAAVFVRQVSNLRRADRYGCTRGKRHEVP